ncbi:diacylglycerol kinase family protein [Sporosarcina sp. FA9]|uniref:diacylglycerol kinase family protein n=1 Tax=Sporosarcina sp. FA9 TaxID=3413030 RepID=UPI003F65B35C
MRKFFKAFKYAWDGILFGLRVERNLKFHFLAGLIVVIAGFLTGLTLIEWFVILILIGGMLSLELVNSAIERVVNLVTTEIHPLAKQAKDLAAGAVLIYAVISGVIGLLLFASKWFK